ncbi:Uncharacterised protein [Streptococcus pneumoniae]|nr:Uncharacterised protein [Streptococcus pneumoniae]
MPSFGFTGTSSTVFSEFSFLESLCSGLFDSPTEVVESLGLLDSSPVFSLDVSGDTFSEFVVDSSAG